MSPHSNPPPPNGDKHAWRRHITSLFASVDPAERALADANLNSRLEAYCASLAEGVLFAFAPLPDEPDITPFLRAWLRGGCELALPAWAGGREMEFRLVRDLDHDLTPGKGGIGVPRAVLPAVNGDAAVAIVTPGRAFGEDRLRLGRGAGCYDALFLNRKKLKIGVCYDFQVFPSVPGGEGDVPVDVIVTPARVI